MQLPPQPALEGSDQLIVVAGAVAPGRPGSLSWLEREGDGWRLVAGPFGVSTGRGGMAWGGGRAPGAWNRTGLPPKRDGDGRTPCGLFSLSFAFGVGPALPEGPGWPYLQLHPGFVIVEDPASRYYNCVVDQRLLRAPDWRSARPLLQPDGRNDLGLVILHNLDPAVPGAGTGVLLRLRLDGEGGTGGSIALPLDRMRALLGFLDPARQPLLWVVEGVEGSSGGSR